MKAAFLLLLLFASAPNLWAQQNILSDTELKFKQLHWLIGTWERIGLEGQKRGFEKWEMESDSVYKGIGLMLSGSDTVFVEKLKIVIEDDQLYYVADVPENPEPVLFEFIKVGNNYFVSRNPKHDFPRVITYRLENGELKATVSNDIKKIEYRFKKQ